MFDSIIEYALIMVNAAAFAMLAAGIVSLNARKTGGIHFFRFGRFGGSFYIIRGGR